MTLLNSYFGEFGGMYVPQILMPALYTLEKEFIKALNNNQFNDELSKLLNNYAGRPTPLTLCRNLTKGTNTKLYLKREDLLHGGAHKTNQALGQALLAKQMNKKNIIAETGAGQHGVAAALSCALFNLKCKIYMGEQDIIRQKQNVTRMKLFGAKIISVKNGSGTLKDACNEAIRDWSENYQTSHYMLGTVVGPHPYPTIVKKFQSIIGIETKKQIIQAESCLPHKVIACVGGGSNAIGIFSSFLENKSVKLIGVEPAGEGIKTGAHGSTLQYGSTGIYFGMKSPIIQTKEGQIKTSWSISSGLNFPGVGPEHAWLKSIGRVIYVSITDKEAVFAFKKLCELEGIIPALESSHALAYAIKLISKNPKKTQTIIVNISGRGDKDIDTVKKYLYNSRSL